MAGTENTGDRPSLGQVDMTAELLKMELLQSRQDVVALEDAVRKLQLSHAEALERCSSCRLEHQHEMASLVTDHANRLGEARLEAMEQEAFHWRGRVERLTEVCTITRHVTIKLPSSFVNRLDHTSLKLD